MFASVPLPIDDPSTLFLAIKFPTRELLAKPWYKDKELWLYFAPALVESLVSLITNRRYLDIPLPSEIVDSLHEIAMPGRYDKSVPAIIS